MLAEPRRKQKLSVDPQNVKWRRDENGFGQKLLKRMGWKDGAGIGRNEQGTADNVSLKPNFTSSGLGANTESKQREEWIAHHDDFASFLEQLNKNKTGSNAASGNEEVVATTTVSIEEASRNMKRRIHYKFTRGKDLSMASEQEKSQIFGHKMKKPKKVVDEPNPEKEKAAAVSVDQEDKGKEVKTEPFTEKNLSASDHYADKMKKWAKFFTKPAAKAEGDIKELSRGSADTLKMEVEITEEIMEQDETVKEKKSKKKSKKEKRLAEAVGDEPEHTGLVEQVEEVQRKKKNKKRRHDTEPSEDLVSEVQAEKPKKKRHQ